MLLANSIPFDVSDPRTSLAGLPESAGVFALFAADPAAEPYLSKTPNLRRRLMRFLSAAPTQTRRLALAHMVDHIEYSVTGSEFESMLCLYEASLRAFGERARKRLRLRPPAMLRMSTENAYPRVYATTRISRAAADSLFGPFPSRAAAERFADEMLNLFLLRRCTEELHPDPAFPGCVYSEMKMCLAPCFKGCTDARYAEEAAGVHGFLSTRGASLMAKLEAERAAASEELEFERAAAVHQRIEKVEAVAHLASEAVRPLSQLNAIVVQPAAEPGSVTLFRLKRGMLRGPVLFSTLGMRHPNPQSGSSSLFAHPAALQPVPLEPAIETKDVIEARLEEALRALSAQPEPAHPQAAHPEPKMQAAALADHMALFARWYYQPAARRAGEAVFFGGDEAHPALKGLLRAISRVARAGFAPLPGTLSHPTALSASAAAAAGAGRDS